jgi:hypothetical protein
MNAGERRFAQRLESLLGSETLCWYDVAFGAKHQHPDFVVLHPQYGLLVLELREWKIEQILAVGRMDISLAGAEGCQAVSNPLEQAHQYATGIRQALACDPQLCDQPTGSEPQLRCPLGFGLILSHVSRDEFNNAQLGEALPAHRIICKDEMTESIDATGFAQRLWQMASVATTATTLDALQVDRIRYHLFPELRIQQGSLFIGHDTVSNDPAGPLRVMDLQQEKLARSLGDGHRVVHGVAGSGKTMILAYRCAQLARRTDKPVLVLCYNDSLAARLAQLLVDQNLLGRVIVRHFHGWCLDQLRLHRVEQPAAGAGLPGRLVRAVTQAVNEQRIPTSQYSAVLIDEGHDFEPPWFKLLSQMVDASSNSLLLLYDDAQGIYGKKRSRDFSFAKFGIQARGRTTILRVNYRNTSEVLDYAFRFARDSLVPEENTEADDAIPFVTPLGNGRSGVAPQLTQCASLEDETRHIAAQLQALHAQGNQWRDMAVLYPTRLVGEALAQHLQEQQMPVQWLQTSRFKHDVDCIKLMTLHNSKGLEFPVVAIAGLGFMPYQESEAMEDTRLLYIGMTRAVERLILTAHRSSAFVKQLAALHGTANQLH